MCQRLDDERVVKARRKTRDGAPSQQEEGARHRESARLSIKARVEETYAALKALVEEEKRSRSQADAEETDLPYEMEKYRYDGTTGAGAEQDTLSTCGNRTVEAKAGIPITGSGSTEGRFRARQPETPDIVEANFRHCLRDRKEGGYRPRGVCGYGHKQRRKQSSLRT